MRPIKICSLFLLNVIWLTSTQYMRADGYTGTLDLQVQGCPSFTGSAGPVSGSCSVTGSNGIYPGNGSGTANYTSLGVAAAVPAANAVNQGSAHNSTGWIGDILMVGGIASGTPVDLTFFTDYGGTYNFTSSATGVTALNDTQVIEVVHKSGLRQHPTGRPFLGRLP